MSQVATEEALRQHWLDVGADPLLDLAVSTARVSTEGSELFAVCLAVELDRRLQRLVAHLAADSGTTRLDRDLVARLLGADRVDQLADDAPLVTSGLLEVIEGPTYAGASVAVPSRVARALTGDRSLDPWLPLGTELIRPGRTAGGAHEMVLVHGADRVRRQQAAVSALAADAFLLCTAPTDDAGWWLLVRQATVLGAAVVLDLPDGLTTTVRDRVQRADHLAWGLSTTQPADLADVPRRDHVELAAAPPDVTDHEWMAAFPGHAPPARRPTAAQLDFALNAPDLVDDPQELLRRVATGTLLSHATRVVPRVTWDELVLPPGQEAQLRSLVDRYQHRSTVHDEWGLSLYPSPGVVALFSGPSGTGKTTSAEVIAHELGVDMFRVDLSALVSKYIGETEKNLEEIFSAAHTGNYLLLFDEADSLFGSRSKVEDAKDRYANLEVSYLLQRLETYDGLVVLTSNFQGNIDPAFLRRIHVTVHFTVPSAEERLRIWRRALGRAPLGEVDLEHIAGGFDLTGGSIRNAALGAAFAAAAGGGRVEMADLIRAVTQEMTKLGRRVTDTQLGAWGAAPRDARPLGGGGPTT